MTRSAPLPDSQLPASLPLNIQQQQAARHSAAPGALQHQSSDPLVLASMHQVSAAECWRAAAHLRWCAVLCSQGSTSAAQRCVGAVDRLGATVWCVLSLSAGHKVEAV